MVQMSERPKDSRKSNRTNITQSEAGKTFASS